MQQCRPEAQWPDQEKELCDWIEHLRKSNPSLSTALITIKSKQIGTEKGLNDFKGGPSLCNPFFKRNKLVMKAWTTVSQKLLNSWEEKKESFLKFVKEEFKKYVLKPSEVGNMDVPTSYSAHFVSVKVCPCSNSLK